jgi:hypothetical protein
MSTCYEQAYASPALSLNAKRSIKNDGERGINETAEKELQKYLGPEWHYSIDFVELYTMMAKYEDPDPDRRGNSAVWAERMGEIVCQYLFPLTTCRGAPLEQVGREALSKDAFNAKAHRKVICIKLTTDHTTESEMMSNTDPKKGLYANFDYVDGAFVVSIRLERVAVNCGYILDGPRIMNSL